MSEAERNDAEETDEASTSTHNAELIKELIDMTKIAPGSNQLHRERAMKKYAGYGPEYQKRNNARIEAANTPGNQKIKLDRFGGGVVTMSAQINTQKSYDPADTKKEHPLHDPSTGKLIEGKVIDGHDENPEAQSMIEIEQALQDYLAITPRDQQLIIFEGLPATEGQLADRSAAIKARSDTGLIQFLAHKNGVEAMPAESDIRQETIDFMAEGVSRHVAMLFYTLRSLAVPNKEGQTGEVPTDLTMHVYAELAMRGIDDFVEIPLADRQNLVDHPELLAPYKARVIEVIREGLPDINQLLLGSNLPPLVIGPNESIGFSGVVTSAALMHNMDPSGDTKLSEVSRLNIASRDKRIFQSITDAVISGKRPFVQYGGSHVVSLEPVMEEYFGSRESVKL